MPLFPTRSELLIAVRSETEKTSHAKFDDALPRFVAGAEQRMFYGSDAPFPSEAIRLRAMETTDGVTLTAGVGDLPADYLAARSLRWMTAPYSQPKYQAPENFWADRYDLTNGSPVAFTIEGSKLHVSPKVTGDITLAYYALPAALETETSTNAVLTAHPMIYFHAVLIEAYLWLRNTTKAQESYANFTGAVSGLLNSDRKARQGGNQLAMRIPNWRS